MSAPGISAPSTEGGKSKKTKSGTTLERVTWMSRTSDVLGSHLKTDLDSYLTLIRRKIQEKCATTVELMTMIRRFKINDSGHVTPNEFRFTLIKFGVILPQPLVDRIFTVFDSDRSGTMDFDEFATWIMNSEFRPSFEKKSGADSSDSPEVRLRKKLAKIILDHPRVFTAMKKQISFLEFVSDINRTGIPLTEREARTIFQTLDPKDCGFIESAMFKIYADTGRITPPPQPQPSYEHTAAPGALKEIINRVVGRNTRQLENAFAHIQRGKNTKLPYEEFRRCLLNGGVGKNMADFRELFMALGGRTEGLADVDLFFRTIEPILDDPTSMVSVKKSAPPDISTSRADRRLRDSIRKSYKDVKADLEREDAGHTGFISAEKLYKILVKRCMALTFEDFRFIVQQIRTEPGTDRIDYRHFLHGYNPAIPPHQLSNLSTLRNYTEPAATTSTPSLNNSSSLPGFANTAPGPLRLNSLSTMPRARDDLSLTNTTSTAASLENPELRRIWQSVLRECHRADPERTGQINRNTFLAALERADGGKTMSPDAMSALAEKYTLSNGLVNYLLLFRNFLQDLTSSSNTLTKSQSVKTLSKSMSLPAHTEHEVGKIHPWEFGYERKRHQNPYWENATTMPATKNFGSTKSLGASLSSFPPPLTDKDGSMYTPHEKELLLSKYDATMLDICARCYKRFAPVWRPLRNDFKKQQVPTQKGNILATHFISVLESHGISLSKKELGLIVKNFRGLGMEDLVKYDDFLRICMLMKDSSS